MQIIPLSYIQRCHEMQIYHANNKNYLWVGHYSSFIYYNAAFDQTGHTGLVYFPTGITRYLTFGPVVATHV